MGNISLDLAKFKSAGVYTLEYDNSQRTTVDADTLRVLIGFNPKGCFNRPVLLENDSQRDEIFGPIDTKLEKKGCFFNRFAQILLRSTPIFALNLLKVDDSQNGPDQVNFTTMSLDAGARNPYLPGTGKTYGESEYNSSYIEDLYGRDIAQEGTVPYVGKAPFASMFDRSRFWNFSEDNLVAVSALKLGTGDQTTFEHTNLLSFANVGTEEFSILVYKAEGLSGYDITAKEWYGGEENIPYKWIRPSDYMSDYFLQVVAIKGNWTNYSVLSTDPLWSPYFDSKGILKNKVASFAGAEGITLLGSWTGCIIPDFFDKQGNNQSIINKINLNTEKTGLLMAFNEDAAQSLSFDYNGIDKEDGEDGIGCWFYDYDSDNQGSSSQGESEANKFLVDMVGHNFEKGFSTEATKLEALDNTDFPAISIKKKNFYYFNYGSLSLEEAQKALSVPEERKLASITILNDSSVAHDTYFYGIYGNLEGTILTLATVKKGTRTDSVIYTSIDTEEGRFVYSGEEYFVKLSDNGQSVEFSKMIQENKDENKKGIVFLSYNYIEKSDAEEKITEEFDAIYFNSLSKFKKDETYEQMFKGTTITSDNFNMFAVFNKEHADKIKVNDLVKNKAFLNEEPASESWKDFSSSGNHLIPGLTRILKKIFVTVDAMSEFTYKGAVCEYLGDTSKLIVDESNGAKGFYLFTAIDPVYIEADPMEVSEDGPTEGKITRQLPISDSMISKSLRFIPMKGLKISNRHKPGYDSNGNIDMEAGVAKIYSVLDEEGMKRGMCNPDMIDYRYIVDSMSYGLDTEMGGKAYLSKLAKLRGKTTALLNMPSVKQFTISSNPYFCDTYQTGSYVKPSFNVKYIPEGGNAELFASRLFSLPTEDSGSKYSAAFWPNLTYTVNGKKISVPPAADVANVLIRKFQGGDPYMICANMNGILKNPYLTGIEYKADTQDRDYLEPFGVNTIIEREGQIMIYGNQTCYQKVKSDFNKLHVRENLNTIEIECEKILKKYNFEYNTSTLRSSIVTALTPVLQTMQESGAIDSYEIQCDEDNNTEEIIQEGYLIVDIAVSFNHGAEKIVNRITVNKLGSISNS